MRLLTMGHLEYFSDHLFLSWPKKQSNYGHINYNDDRKSISGMYISYLFPLCPLKFPIKIYTGKKYIIFSDG